MKDIKKVVMNKIEASVKLWIEIAASYDIELEAIEENGKYILRPKNEQAAADRNYGLNGTPADNWYIKAKIEFDKRVKLL